MQIHVLPLFLFAVCGVVQGIDRFIPVENIIADLSQRFADVESSELRGRTRMIVPRDSMLAALRLLRNSPWAMIAAAGHPPGAAALQ